VYDFGESNIEKMDRARGMIKTGSDIVCVVNMFKYLGMVIFKRM